MITRPDRRRGGAASWRRRRWPRPPARLGIETIQPDNVNGEESRERIAALEPGAVCHLRLRRADQGAAALRARAGQRPPVATPPLARRRADRAGDRGGGRGDGRDHHEAAAEMDAGPICLQRNEPIRSDDDFGSLAARLAVLGGELLVEALDAPPRSASSPDRGDLRREDRPRRSPARPPARPPRSSSGACGRSPRTWARSSSWTRGAPRGSARGAGRGGPTSRRAHWRLRASGCCWAPASGCSELLEVQPPGGRPMAPATSFAATAPAIVG